MTVQFLQLTCTELGDLVKQTTSSTLPYDVAPSDFLKKAFDTVGPSIQVIIISCLVSGTVPAFLKHPVIQPLLEKPNADINCLNNYHPISKLPFIKKILERVVLSQLLPFLNSTHKFEPFQSGFTTHHSTETALLKVLNVLLLSVDSGDNAVLVLLDLSAAFDTVDHNILLSHLEHWLGIKGTVLCWFESYLKSWYFSVSVGQFISSSASLLYGVPQRSILGPLIFNLYMLPLGNIIRKYTISLNFYADDSHSLWSL